MKPEVQVILGKTIHAEVGYFLVPEPSPRLDLGANPQHLVDGDLDGLVLCSHTTMQKEFDQRSGYIKISVTYKGHLKFRGSRCELGS